MIQSYTPSDEPLDMDFSYKLSEVTIMEKTEMLQALLSGNQEKLAMLRSE